MKNFSVAALSVGALLAATPALAGAPVPAPLLDAGLPGLALLGLAGGGYLLLKMRRRS